MVNVAKFHGTGNDFVVVDADEEVPNRRAFAKTLCDRDGGLWHPESDRTGADGVLFLALEEGFRPPRIVMTLVQPDGSVAAMCGNGARCAALWAADRTGADEIMIDTQAGTRRATVSDGHVTIEMGAPSFDPTDVPLVGDAELIEEDVAGLTVTAVDTGVPHAVAFVDDVTDVDLDSIGPEIRYHDRFPEGTNVNLASKRPDGGFDQRTYERGVEAETDSCGTGAVAIAAAATRLDRAETDRVVVHPPGGRLVVTIDGDETTLEGPVERAYAGQARSPVSAAGD